MLKRLAVVLFIAAQSFVGVTNAQPVLNTQAQRVTPSAINGWTHLKPAPDSRLVYVSTAGDDANTGLSPSAPKRTIASALMVTRDGYPDWVLLRRGDVFPERVIWWNSGRSRQYPTVLTAYGEGDRPLVKPEGIWDCGFLSFGPAMNHVAIVSVAFDNDAWTGNQGGNHPVGISIIKPGTDLLIEDVYVEGFAHSIIIQGYPTMRYDTRIRRSVLVDPRRTDPNNGSVHIFMAEYDGVLLEENVFDFTPQAIAAGYHLSHCTYIGEGYPGDRVRVVGNIARNGGRTNFNQRSGGWIQNNLSIRGAQGITVGIGYAPWQASATICDNVILESRNNSNGQELGFGIGLDKVRDVWIFDNIIAHSTDGTNPHAFAINGTQCEDVLFAWNVVYNWHYLGFVPNWCAQNLAMWQPSGPIELKGNYITLNSQSCIMGSDAIPMSSPLLTFQGNWYWSMRQGDWFHGSDRGYTPAQWATEIENSATFAPFPFPQPMRTIASYQATLEGVASTDAFMIEARKQSKTNWRPAYTAARVNTYIRAGFGR